MCYGMTFNRMLKKQVESVVELFSEDKNADLGHVMSVCSLQISKLWPFKNLEVIQSEILPF